MAKFQIGNPYGKLGGRPRKNFDKKYFLESSIDEQGLKDLIILVQRKALGENVNVDLVAAKMIFDFVPMSKSSTHIKTKVLQGIKTEEQLDTAMEETLNEVGDGEMSIEVGLDVATLIEKRGVVLMKKELNALNEEEERAKDE